MSGFFEDFSTRLCKERGLVDVAPEGQAGQSSTSNWSRENDAQRAVSKVGRQDFAFHTDHEDRAWWRLDFEKTHYPELICIENRGQKEFWNLASKIRVKVSTDGHTWSTLHEGVLSFGTFSNGTPLLLPLGGLVPVRHILIENTQSGYLHLKSIQVLARNALSSGDQDIVFMADRTDGFGERLKSMVNSIALAEYYEADFRFSWKSFSKHNSETHAVGNPEDTFSQDFLENMSAVAPNIGLREFLNKAKGVKGRASLPKISPPPIISVPQNIIYSHNSKFEEVIPRSKLAAAFWKIGFSNTLSKAIDLALNVDIDETAVGLHLRSGDIVFGRYRFNSRYLGKVVPYPIAFKFVEKQKELGRNVVVFGQDAEMCREIAKTYDVVFAGEYHLKNNFNQFQAALFDIVLMSRCSSVVAGLSGFSQIAQIVGQFKMIDPGEVFTPQESIDIIMKALEANASALEVHDYQKAFACSYAVNVLSDFVSIENGILLMKQASRLDPKNSFYSVLLAIASYRAGNTDFAQSTLKTALDSSFQKPNFGSLETLISTKHPDGRFALDKQERYLSEMSDQGIASASGILALFYDAKGNGGNAKKYRDKFLKSCPAGEAPQFAKKIKLIK